MNETLDHYHIQEKLGEGGMGVVYRAWDERLRRDVALKVIAPAVLADEAARARFHREALALSQLNHPNICTIFEIGEANGQDFIAMEYVEGKQLSSLLAAGALPLETIVLYTTQIADALAHAHERGIVHRDLKSSNVLITPEGRAKVLDFGVAKSMIQPQEETQSLNALTEAGRVLGTPAYMAPELLRGSPADRRSDIWALGVMLHEMVTGQLPFRGKSYFDMCSAIAREPAPTLPDSVPTGLRTLIQRCLAKEPGQRYQFAVEVRAAVGVIGQGVNTAGKGDQPRPGKVLSTGAPASPNQDANRYFENALLSLVQYDLPKMQRMLERALELDPHFAEARGYHGFTHWLMIDSGYSNDSSLLYLAEDEFRQALRDNPDSPIAHMGFAAVFFFQGQKDLAPLELAKALRVYPDHRDVLHILMCFHWISGDYVAMEALAKTQMERHPLFWPTRMDYGDALRSLGKVSAAIREQENVLEQDPNNLYAVRFLARAQLDAGDPVNARRTLERAPVADRHGYWKIISALLLAVEGRAAEATEEMDGEVLKYASFVVWYTAEVAGFYSVLEDIPTALEWLERAVRNGDERLEWFRREPLFANLRSHSRFNQILESVAYRRELRNRARNMQSSSP
jgi:serine/threonine protein kinase